MWSLTGELLRQRATWQDISLQAENDEMLICNCFISCYIGFYSFLPAFSWLICFLIMISWYQEFIGFIRRSSVYMCLIQTQQRRQTLFKTQLAVILSLMYTMSIENRTRQFFCMSYHIRKHKFLQGSSRFKFKVKLTKHTRVLWTPFLITKIMEQFRLPQWWHLDSLPPCSF